MSFKLPKDANISFLDSPRPTLIAFKGPLQLNLRDMWWSFSTRDAIEQNAKTQWREEVEDRGGTVIEVEEDHIVARHTGAPHEHLPVEGCLACTLEQRKAEGHPPSVRMHLHVMRDVRPVELVPTPVPAEKHRRRQWMSESYHRRVQKKWNKKVVGLLEMRPKQELVILSMSRAAFQAVQDVCNSQRRTGG